MSKRTMEELKELLNHELDMLTKKGDITKESLEYFDKLTHTLKSLEYIIQAEDGGMSNGYSQRGYSRNDYSQEGYSQGRYRMPMGGMYYDEGNSNARRGRDGDGDGRYSERDGRNSYNDSSYEGGSYDRGSNGRSSYDRGGYSRHTAKERMIEKLTDMMNEASTESERIAIRRCIDQIG